MNQYQMLAREKKARALAAICRQHGITADEAKGASESDWELAARAAKVHPPSEETQRIVIAMLRDMEKKQ